MLDETTNDQKDTPQPEAGLTSEGEGGITSDQAGKIFKESEVTKMISDERAKFGRERAKLTSQIETTRSQHDSISKELDSTQSRIDALERQIRESKLDRGDPASVQAFQEQESLVARERELKKREREQALKEVRFEGERKTQFTERVSAIAERYGVEVADLENLGTSNISSIERYAKAVGKAMPGKKKAPVEGDDFVPDSNLGSGGVGKLTVEAADAMPIERYAAVRKKQMGLTS